MQEINKNREKHVKQNVENDAKQNKQNVWPATGRER